jgi:capsular polysaccharide biosynthesis protein
MGEGTQLSSYRIKQWLKRQLRPYWKAIKTSPYQVQLLGARTVARIFPYLSIDRDRLYPPEKIWRSTAEWFSKSGKEIHATVREFDAECIVHEPLPKTVHENVRQQFYTDPEAYPATFVVTIPRGRVIKRGLVLTPDGQLLKDVSTYFHDPRKTIAASIADDWRLGEIRNVSGRVAVLATDAANLYYHWLFQLLPRFELMRLAGFEMSSIDCFVVNSMRSKFQRETLEVLGIEANKVIESDRVPHLRAQELVVPSVPLGGGCFRPWMTDFLRNSFLPKNREIRPFARRVYISRARAGYRRIVNESEIVEFLTRRGFQTVTFEGLSVRDQAAVMMSCDVIVAPHGGGLSNIVFCSPGTKIIEIFSPELVARYFWRLSNRLHLDYYYILGKGPPGSLEADYPQSWDAEVDIEVDLGLLERTLTLAGVH